MANIDASLLFSVFNSWTTAAIAFLVWLYFYIGRKLSYWESKGVNGPKIRYPFQDIFPLFYKPIATVQNDHYRQYGPTYGTYAGLKPVLVVGDPEHVKEICVKEYHSFPEGFKALTQNEIEQHFLSFLYGPRWKRVRSLLSPLFTTGRLKGIFNLLKDAIDKGTVELNKIAQAEKKVDPKMFWEKYNLDVIAKCCFAVSLNPFEDEDNVFVRNFREFFSASAWRFVLMSILPMWISDFIGITNKRNRNIAFFHDLVTKVLNERKNSQNTEQFSDFLHLMVKSEASPEKVADIMAADNSLDQNVFMKEGKQLSTLEIVSSTIIFLIAGFETTSTLLNWSFYQLAMNPDIQERLYEEVSSKDTNEYETLMSLPYLNAVINETLRINPPVVLFQRVAHQNTVLSGPIEVKKGTTVTFPIYAIHHDEKNFFDPERFDPSRFLPENKHLIKPYTFVPFGEGPKHCIGMRFALVNAKLALAETVRKFRLLKINETHENISYDLGTAILSTPNLKIGLEAR